MTSRNYSATIVVDPSGSDGSTSEMIPKLSEVIAQSDGEVTKVQELGQHDFAYPSRKRFLEAHIFSLSFQGLQKPRKKLRKNCDLKKRLIVS